MNKEPNGINIYLAGKIAPNDWRLGLVPDLRRNSHERYNSMVDGSDDIWAIRMNVIDGRHNYTGPYFIGCDHRCYHGESSHGCGAGEDGGCYDHGQCAPGCTDYNETFQDRDHITKQCLEAIDKSDVVFAWIDTADCFGTIFELGYALAKHKKIVLAMPQDNDDMWFMQHAIGQYHVYHANTPRDALDMFLDTLPAPRESPIEEKFYDTATRLGLQLSPQFEIRSGGHAFRADFAIPSKRIAIEIDGHEYHKTKEQRTNDAQRERAMQREGWKVIRFTGSEVFKNCEKCVREVVVFGGIS